MDGPPRVIDRVSSAQAMLFLPSLELDCTAAKSARYRRTVYALGTDELEYGTESSAAVIVASGAIGHPGGTVRYGDAPTQRNA